MKLTGAHRRLLDDMIECDERGAAGMSCEQRKALAEELYEEGLCDRYEIGQLMYYRVTAKGKR